MYLKRKMKNCHEISKPFALSRFSKKYNPISNLIILGFKILGLWPLNSQYQLFNTIQNIYGKICIFTFIAFHISQYIELYLIGDDLDELTFNLPLTFIYTLATAKVLTIFMGTEKIKKLVENIVLIEEHLVHCGSDEIGQIINHHFNNQRIIVVSYYILILFCLLFFGVTPIYENYAMNAKYGSDPDSNSTLWTRAMVFSSYFPFDKHVNPNYYFAIGFQCIMGVLGSAFHITFDLFVISAMLHVITQIQVLHHNVARMEKSGCRQSKILVTKFIESLEATGKLLVPLYDIKDDILQSFAHHRYIIRTILHIDALISPVMTLYLMTCSIQICTAAYQVTVLSFGFRLLCVIQFLLTVMAQLFIYMWYSNDVMWESNHLLGASYECAWHRIRTLAGRDLILLRHALSKQLCFTVGPLHRMSIPIFLKILKASYSYFALLRQVQDRK